MVRIKMMATGDPSMWRRRGTPRPVRIPTDSDEEAMDNPPPVPTTTDTAPTTGTEPRRSDSPDIQTYHRRNKARMIEPPPSSPTVAMDTQGGETPQEDTTSTSHGQKRLRTPSPPPPPPPPSPEQHPETPIDTHPASYEEGHLPNDLPKPAHSDHITQALTFNKASERAQLDRVSSLPYHASKYIHHGTLEALRLQD
ncbi:swi5-dependent recombination DNA repair protein 1 homolog [Manihot esculenta]|uniref:swi5-dependent recombination DNA repair protein 1 homolog n=1 Tax=Manihot esculenta TaxID=3983 RepID=UPI000B5D7F54|nr:swi5-dependent recombination DNA repair protein 1 homolog [Manihot esculenta]